MLNNYENLIFYSILAFITYKILTMNSNENFVVPENTSDKILKDNLDNNTYYTVYKVKDTLSGAGKTKTPAQYNGTNSCNANQYYYQYRDPVANNDNAVCKSNSDLVVTVDYDIQNNSVPIKGSDIKSSTTYV
jgi:hypothetical protein